MTLNGKQELGFPPVIGDRASATKSSDQAVVSTSQADLTSLVVTLPASVGDIFLIGVSYAWNTSAAVDSSIFVYTTVGGTPTTFISGLVSAQFVGTYCGGTNGEIMNLCFPYTVIAADLGTGTLTSGLAKGKTVTFQVRANLGTAGTRTFIGASSPKVNIWAIPLGRVRNADGVGF